MRHPSVALVTLALMSGSAFAADPTGDWMVEDGKAIIRIGPCTTVQVSPTAGAEAAEAAPTDNIDPHAPLCGLLAWSKVPAKGDPDYNPRLAGKTPIGTKILSEMKPTGENRWEGEVINPRNGKVYQSYMTLKSTNVLRIEGCLLGFLCGSQEWTRQ